MVVGRHIPLIVSVGAPTATNSAQSSREFAFDFAGVEGPVHFTVHVDADPEMWAVREVQPTLIVMRPGKTEQEAMFLVSALQPGRDKLHLSVERDGTTIQHVWLPVVAALESATAAPALARRSATHRRQWPGATRRFRRSCGLLQLRR